MKQPISVDALPLIGHWRSVLIVFMLLLIFGWCMISGPGSNVTFWMVTPPTNWSLFSEYLQNSLSMNFHVSLFVRELKLLHWCYLHCWVHTPHLQTKGHIALFVRLKQKRSKSTWDKVIQSYVALWLYASRFPSVNSCINKPAGAPNSMIYCSLTDN
jgi:hypothetical protein